MIAGSGCAEEQCYVLCQRCLASRFRCMVQSMLGLVGAFVGSPACFRFFSASEKEEGIH